MLTLQALTCFKGNDDQNRDKTSYAQGKNLWHQREWSTNTKIGKN